MSDSTQLAFPFQKTLANISDNIWLSNMVVSSLYSLCHFSRNSLTFSLSAFSGIFKPFDSDWKSDITCRVASGLLEGVDDLAAHLPDLTDRRDRSVRRSFTVLFWIFGRGEGCWSAQARCTFVKVRPVFGVLLAVPAEDTFGGRVDDFGHRVAFDSGNLASISEDIFGMWLVLKSQINSHR